MSESGSQEVADGAANGSGSGSPTRRPQRPSIGNKVTVVLGAQWGDEGKGKVVDLLAQDADMVCRCQVGETSRFLYDSRAPLCCIHCSVTRKSCGVFLCFFFLNKTSSIGDTAVRVRVA